MRMVITAAPLSSSASKKLTSQHKSTINIIINNNAERMVLRFTQRLRTNTVAGLLCSMEIPPSYIP
jgi:hypothetical protein